MGNTLGNGLVLRRRQAVLSDVTLLLDRFAVFMRLPSRRTLTHEHAAAGLRVHVTGDGSNVYQDSFLRDARNSDGVFQPTLLLLGVRLGIDRVTPVYWDALKASLQMEQSVGIAG